MAEVAANPSSVRAPPQDGPFVLRKLVSDLPLSADGSSANVHITCVEVWNGNLYVGTSAAEILHFVLLPPETSDPSEQPTAIIASRLAPPHNDDAGPGVQQILLLTQVNKACVLCNNTFSIYSLPELSPESNFKPIPCLWVGGVDLNEQDEGYAEEGVVVVIGLKKRLRLVQISDNSPPRAIKAIEYGGCLTSARRDTFSCAADAHSYALLDVVNQQKIGLFPISSLDPDAVSIGGAAETLATVPQAPSRSVSSASPLPRSQEEQRGHGRSTSLNILGFGSPAPRMESPRPAAQRYGFDIPESLSRNVSPAPSRSPARSQAKSSLERESSQTRVREVSPEKPLPPPPVEEATPRVSIEEPPPPTPFVPLRPHIASPTPNEFLLTVGTTPLEPGVGMFVNLDGDMCRGSIQFSSYPEAIVVDGSGIDLTASTGPDMDAEEGYVLAVVQQVEGEQQGYGVEMQRWDVEAGEADAENEWLNLSLLQIPDSMQPKLVSSPLGIRTIVQAQDLVLPEISDKLTVQRLRLGVGAATSATQASIPQAQADIEFAQRLAKLQARHVLWVKDQIWWTVRNPLVTRLDSRIEAAQTTPTGDGKRIQPQRALLERVLGDIRGQEPRNESEYLSLIYIRQKASVLLFMDVVLRTRTNIIIFENEKRITEQALIDGEVDPRVVLSLLPILNEEVVQGLEGIQISGGIVVIVEQFLEQNTPSSMPTHVNGPFGDNLLHFVKRYLQFWKRRKGMASVTNDPYVFQSVDAALLHILLLLDQRNLEGGSTPGPHRAELNEMVDKEVECLDRAVELLESFHRLYILSRLYQSNCKAAVKASKVLATWKRIIEGERDDGGEFADGENEVRKYLARIRDQSLVEEYGAWLANRNPNLGVQVFADDQSRVKFEPTRAVALLKERAPGAVKEYLEYLVFGKKHTQYVDELINFYLDTVITELDSNPASREILAQTYETYRILAPPRPTYHSFITDNAPSAPWWQARLRLLHLLGSSSPSTSSFDVPSILVRLQPYSAYLVSEMIILNGREERHQDALRLLTHGLRDYNTAIAYCLYGPSCIFLSHPRAIPAKDLPTRTQQSHLIANLLHEFLSIEDLSQRITQSSELLERFGAWLDLGDVLASLPDDWSVEVVRGFLVGSLGRLVRERRESEVVRALQDARNSLVSGALVERREGVGGTVERGV